MRVRRPRGFRDASRVFRRLWPVAAEGWAVFLPHSGSYPAHPPAARRSLAVLAPLRLGRAALRARPRLRLRAVLVRHAAAGRRRLAVAVAAQLARALARVADDREADARDQDDAGAE